MWYKNAIEGYKEVSYVNHRAELPNELWIWILTEKNPGFQIGENITYVTENDRISGEITGFASGNRYIDGVAYKALVVKIKSDAPNIADYKDAKGGRIYSVYNPETTVQSQDVAEAEVIGVSQPETIIDKASEGAKKVIEDIRVNQASIFSGKNILIVLGAAMVLAYLRK